MADTGADETSSVVNFIQLATSLLADLIPLDGTTLDKGPAGLGNFNSCLKYLSIATTHWHVEHAGISVMANIKI